jgi:hypothetical protein
MHARFLVKSLFVAAAIYGAAPADASACFFWHRWHSGGCCPQPCCPTTCCATPCCGPTYVTNSCCGTAYQPTWGSPYASQLTFTSDPRVVSYRNAYPYRSAYRGSGNGHMIPVYQTYQPARPVDARARPVASRAQTAQLEGRRYLFSGR